jgi:putative DNA primase/helicase
VRSKSNIGPDGGGWRYALEQVAVPGHPLLTASRVRWGSALEGEARDLLATAEAANDPEERNALADAVEFLRSLLTDGPQPAKAIRSDGENAGHTWRTMHRAADKLNVDRRKEGMRGGWVWRLPAKMPSNTPEDANFPEQETLAPSQSLAPSESEPPPF